MKAGNAHVTERMIRLFIYVMNGPRKLRKRGPRDRQARRRRDDLFFYFFMLC